jgi:DNA-binding NarL/FixJ family response regulator
MKIAASYIEQSQYSFDGADTARVRAVVVDSSPTYLQAVCALLDFHEIVDLVGRAANFNESVQLVVDLQPDLIFVDLNMPCVDFLIALMVLSGDIPDMKIVAMSSEESIPLQAPGLMLNVSAFIHKARIRQEFLLVFKVLFELPTTSQRLLMAPGSDSGDAEKSWESHPN